MNRLRLFAGILTLAVGLLGRTTAAEPIKLGEVDAFTGRNASFGQSSHKGIVIALEEINARGGILGRPVEIVADDNQSRPGDSATIAKKLLTRDRVAAIICGGASTDCLEAGPVCQALHVPMVASTATAASVTEKGNYVFRNCFIDPFQGAVLAKFAHEVIKAPHAALLTCASAPYSVGLSSVFRERFAVLGGAISSDLKYSDGDRDFRAQLTAIRADAPDVMVLTGFYTEAALICKQARELGITCPIIGGDGLEAPELVEIGGAAVNGVYYSTHYSSESTAPEVQAFVKKFRAKYDGETPDSLAPLAYDATLIIADAITRAGTTDGPKLRDALAATKDFPGVTGRTTIDAQRNATKPAVIVVVRDGHVQFFQSIAP